MEAVKVVEKDFAEKFLFPLIWTERVLNRPNIEFF